MREFLALCYAGTESVRIPFCPNPKPTARSYAQTSFSPVPNVELIQTEIAKGSGSSLIRQTGPRQGQVEINRILYNDSKGKVGLNEVERTYINNQYKAKVKNGQVKKPEYVKKSGLRLEDLCELIDQYLGR
jgi:hypothetical protein